MTPLKNEKGIVLITSYLLLTVLSVFSLAMLSRNCLFLQTTERNANRMRAFNFAESGLDMAIAQLGSNTEYTGASYTNVGNNGGYDVSVCSTATPCPAGITQPIDPEVRIILANGYSPNNTSTTRAYESRPVLAYVELDSTPFEFAAFSEEDMDVGGNPIVDSYNSALGAYGGLNTGTQGHLASDSNIDLVGNIDVAGNISAVEIETGSNVNVNGSINENSAPELNCAPASTSIASSGTLNIAGSTTYNLAAGTYRFDSISITANATLNLLGPVTIYVDGSINVAGNGSIITAGNLPTNLIILATGDDSISLAGNGNFYGGVYAPSSSVTTSGNGSFFGAIIADQYSQSGNGDLHYDTQLADVAAPCISVDILSWRERNTLGSN